MASFWQACRVVLSSQVLFDDDENRALVTGEMVMRMKRRPRCWTPGFRWDTVRGIHPGIQRCARDPVCPRFEGSGFPVKNVSALTDKVPEATFTLITLTL